MEPWLGKRIRPGLWPGNRHGLKSRLGQRLEQRPRNGQRILVSLVPARKIQHVPELVVNIKPAYKAYPKTSINSS